MARARAHLTYANVMATIAVFIALGGGAYAASGGFASSTGVVHGCVGKQGALSVVKAHKRCPKGMKTLTFNQRGQAGANGTPGLPGPATGAAGGDLTGQFPNPSIAPGAVTPDKLGVVPALQTDGMGSRLRTDGGTPTLGMNGSVPSGQRWVIGGFPNVADGMATAEGFGATAPRTGIYEVSTGVVWTDAADSTLRWLILGETNVLPSDINTDSILIRASQAEPAVKGAATIQTLSTFVFFQAGDNVVPIVEQESAGAVAIEDDRQTFFEMRFAGPGP
jgi:hypothetical protein